MAERAWTRLNGTLAGRALLLLAVPVLLAVLFCFAGMARTCAAQAAKTVQRTVLLKAAKRLLLTVPAASAGGHFALMIQVGELPMKASLEVYDEKGALLGSVSPFGAEERRSGGRYTLPLPGNLHSGMKMVVLCTLRLDADHWRRPSDTELQHAEIVAVP